MQTNVFGSTSPAKNKPKSGVNPFASALAETEKKAYSGQPKISDNPFADALARTGGRMPTEQDPAAAQAQENKIREEQRREQLRQKLHKEINPIEATQLFSQREQQVKQEINQIRQELKMLVMDIAKFEKAVDLTLMTQVVDPGEQGKYYLSFFQKLRAFIMLLRQKIKSAGTWATQINGKKKKKRGKGMVGIEVSGTGSEKTDMVQQMMNHENASAISGG